MKNILGNANIIQNKTIKNSFYDICLHVVLVNAVFWKLYSISTNLYINKHMVTSNKL